MTMLPVLDFQEIWLRSAGYIWHAFYYYDVLTNAKTYLSLNLNMGILVKF